jgi:hypothetical protein
VLQEILGLTKAEMPFLGGATFAYLFGRISQDDLVDEIKEYDPSKVSRILSVIRGDGNSEAPVGSTAYVLCNSKLYAWAYFKSRYGGEAPKFHEFGIDKEDAAFLRRLDLSHVDLSYPAYRLNTWLTTVSEIMDSLHTTGYLGKFISKKMTFLIRSYGVRRTELVHDMQVAATRALYMKFPRFDSQLHITNVAKTTASNTGKTLITYHTSPIRQRLVRNSEGEFEACNVSTEAITTLEAPNPYLHASREHLEVLANLGTNMREDVQRFLLCCAGHHDAEFSEYLEMDNTEAVDTMSYSRYIAKARKHFNFSETQVEKLFKKLRTHLSA